MKHLAITTLLICIIFTAHSQDDYSNDEVQTIFSKNKSNGGYGALSFGYSFIDGEDAILAGARGGFIFDHSFAIGISASGFINNLDYHTIYDSRQLDYSLAGGYGGLFIEPIIAGKSPVHLSFPVLFGLGGAALIEDHGWSYDPFNELDHDLFFVVEPAAELEFNVTRFFRTAAFISYRYTSKIELFETDEDVLRGLNFGVTFKFGKF